MKKEITTKGTKDITKVHKGIPLRPLRIQIAIGTLRRMRLMDFSSNPLQGAGGEKVVVNLIF
jgi:hypothetical protein